jgi:hypothetical protein
MDLDLEMEAFTQASELFIEFINNYNFTPLPGQYSCCNAFDFSFHKHIQPYEPLVTTTSHTNSSGGNIAAISRTVFRFFDFAQDLSVNFLNKDVVFSVQ